MMRHFPRFAATFLILAGLAHAQTPAELTETAQYIAAFQNPDGGFPGPDGKASGLGATSSAIRTLKYVGGSIKDVPGAIAYVRSCWDEASGGFAPTPGGKPDSNTTAIGLMAVAELKIADPVLRDKALAYLSEQARTFEEVRLAVAGFEAVKRTGTVFDRWKELVKKDRKGDGTWGQASSQAFATGSAAAALLRMGDDLENKTAVVAALKAGQRSDGGWAKDDGPSDFGSTYRIMRSLYMLREAPDLAAVRKFIAARRVSNGGYASEPGKAADPSATYMAAIILYWTRLFDGLPALIETAGYRPLFNGKDLDGWEGETSLWMARDGMLVGKSPGIDKNQFLATTKDHQDFVLQFSFRLLGGQGNSGAQFRSVRIPGTEMRGYQADIGENYWGGLYDESRRKKVLVPASVKALEMVHKDRWNHYVVRAAGDRIQLVLNGVTAVDYREEDAQIAAETGKIAVQIHSGGPMEIQFQDVLIQPLPSVVKDDALTPGFHLRAAKSSGRKYVLYLPDGFDGKKNLPIALFLHGSGERGDDGLLPTQAGIGPIIAGNPSAFPMIVVFPQARETWAAGSEDSEAAVAVLDEVLELTNADRDKIILTGLSMGGRGTWELAGKSPERFSAVVPICGPGRLGDVPALKALPIWSFVGDNDRDATIFNLREMNAAIKKAGGSPRMTEYRNVPHNSWDRAYSNPTLIEWMLAQTRKPRL